MLIKSQQIFRSMEGTYYAQGCAAKEVNGQSVLAPKHRTQNRMSTETAGFETLGLIQSMTELEVNSEPWIIGIDDNGRIWGFDHLAAGSDYGLLHYVSPDPSPAQYPAITTTTKGFLMYTSASHIGLGVPFVTIALTDDTKIYTAIDFTDASFGTIAGATVKNIDTGDEGTVTSATSSYLNVTGMTGNVSGQRVIVFHDDFKDLDTTNPSPQFAGQPSIGSWKRQIILQDQEYLITNGNYIASFDVYSTVPSGLANYAQDRAELPRNYQATSMDINAANILIGCDYRNRGALIVWDGVAGNDFTNIFQTQTPVKSVTPYKNGWLYVSGNSLRYTDGNQETIVKPYPDLEIIGQFIDVNAEALLMINNRAVMGSNVGYYTRAKGGLYIYDFQQGWTFCPIATAKGQESYGITVGSVFENRKSDVTRIFVSYSSESGEKGVAYYSDAAPDDWSTIIWSKFDVRVTPTKAIVTLGRSHSLGNSLPGTCSVTLNYGNGKEQFWQGATILTGSTVHELNVDETGSSPAQVGDEVIFLSGNNAGERRYVAQRSGTGASTTIILDEDLAAVPTVSSKINRVRLQKSETKTFQTDALPPNAEFNLTSDESEQLFVEIVLNNGSQIDVLGFRLEGDMLD